MAFPSGFASIIQHRLPATPRAIAYAISVVSTGARSAERRDLPSTISGVSRREGLSARAGVYPERSRGGPSVETTEIAICDSPAATPGAMPGNPHGCLIRLLLAD